MPHVPHSVSAALAAKHGTVIEPPGGFKQTESGLLAPASMEKPTYRMPRKDFKRLRSLMKFAREFDLIANFFCQRCKSRVDLERIDQPEATDEDKKKHGAPARLKLSCGCSTWLIR